MNNEPSEVKKEVRSEGKSPYISSPFQSSSSLIFLILAQKSFTSTSVRKLLHNDLPFDL